MPVFRAHYPNLFKENVDIPIAGSAVQLGKARQENSEPSGATDTGEHRVEGKAAISSSTEPLVLQENSETEEGEEEEEERIQPCSPHRSVQMKILLLTFY